VQGVKSETLSQFGVRVTTDGRGFVLPVHSFTGTLVGVKIISVSPEETDSATTATGVKSHITTRTIPRYASSNIAYSWLNSG